MTALRVGVFIQARSNSERLPGKIYARLPGEGYPSILESIYRRLGGISGVSSLAVLIPDADQKLVEYCERKGLQFMCGPEEDVRERYRNAARKFDTDLIIRATGDNPCVDPQVALDTLKRMQELKADLFSFGNLPLGSAVEIFRRDALESNAQAESEACREHVSVHIKGSPHRFRVVHEGHPLIHSSHTDLPRLTVDTSADLEVVRSVYGELGSDFTIPDVLGLQARRPELFLINRHVPQRIPVAS